MPTYYDEKTKTWFCQFRYTDSNGNKKQKRKRGFKTKKEAKEFERDFLATQQQSLEMKFSQFLVLYNEDMSTRLKPKTILVKEYIIKKHILPYFENKKMNKIGAIDIRLWQNEILKMNFSLAYQKKINAQLIAIFNYAEKYYSLKNNPCNSVDSIGKHKSKEKVIYTKEEFDKLIENCQDETVKIIFTILYFTGMRKGDDDDKIRLNQRKPSKYKGLSRFGPEKNLQRINKFMKERPTFYKKLIQMKENFRFYLRCFYCITKVVILQFNSEKQDRISS